jgi:hypothetical protein
MSRASQNELDKNITCVEKAQQKQAKQRSTSLQGVAERAYQRATVWHRGEGVHVTRSASKQLEQIPGLRSVLSLAESSTDFLEALQDTYKSLTTGMTLPRTPDPKMPQKGQTAGGKKTKLKDDRGSTSDPGTTQLEGEEEQQQPLSATFSDNARFEDLATDMDHQEKQRDVLQPRTDSLVLAPQQAEDEENSSQSVTEVQNVKTTRGHVQPGPTGPPGPSGQTRVLSGAAAAVGEERRSSRQVQGEGKSSQGRAFRDDMDDSNSDLDTNIPMYSINDAEFCTEVGVKTFSFLSPNAIQQVSQTLAQTPSTVKHPFPVLTRYFVAKEKDFRAICADFIRHRLLLKQGEAPIFLHEDHPKLVYIVAMKFRAAKSTYRSYRASDRHNDEDQIQLIRQQMSECMRI